MNQEPEAPEPTKQTTLKDGDGQLGGRRILASQQRRPGKLTEQEATLIYSCLSIGPIRINEFESPETI